MKKAYLLSQNELRVLLKGSGYLSVTGISLSQSKISDEVVLNTLNKLVNKGIISNSSNGFVMSDEVRKMITCLGASKSFFAIRSNIRSLTDLCCYIGDNILVCDMMKQRNNDIKMYMISYDEFIISLQDEGYLPVDEWEIPIDEDELEEYEKEFIQSQLLSVRLDEGSKISFSVTLSGYACDELRRIDIITYPLYSYIRFTANNNVSRWIYSFEKLATVLKKNMLDK